MKITESRTGKFTIEGPCGLHDALLGIASKFNDAAEVKLRLAEIARDTRQHRMQAENEVRGGQLVERSAFYLELAKQVPPGRRGRTEKLDCPLLPEVK